MQVSDFEHFRDVLLERRHNLTQLLSSDKLVRTSDAERVRQLITEIKEALERIEDGSFGECAVCHEGVELYRLEVQPVRQICLGCISDDERAALEEDLYLASQIHRALLPQTVPRVEGFEVAVKSLAARNIGGDYYDFLRSADGQLVRVVIADVMGHGLPAGILMSNLQGALRILSSDLVSPGRLLTRLNKWLCRNVPVTKFVSMVCLSLENVSEPETNVVYTNAGHCLPLIVRNSGSVERLPVTGGVLGVDEGFTYDEASVSLSSGDIIVLYTDGVVEAKNAGGETYDEGRLIASIRACQKAAYKNVVNVVVDSVLDFAATPQAADDLTVLTLFKK